MEIYIINLLSIFIYWMIYKLFTGKLGDSKALLNAFMCLIAVQLILLVGLRAEQIGIDTQSYAIRFGRYKEYSLTQIFRDTFQEKGFSLLIKVIGFLTDNFQWFAFFVAVLSVVPTIYVIRKFSSEPFLSIILYIVFDYYASTFSLMRQVLAYNICMIGYLFIRKRKFVWFVITVLIAAQFHESAYIFLPAYFLGRVKINKTTIFVTLLTVAVVLRFNNQIGSFIIEHIFTEYALVKTGAGGWLAMCFLITLFGLLIYPEVKSKRGNDIDGLYMFLFVGMIFMMFSNITQNAMRIANYYYAYVILFIPEVLYAVRKKRLLVFFEYIIVTASLLMYVYFLRLDEYGIIPYIPFWQ